MTKVLTWRKRPFFPLQHRVKNKSVFSERIINACRRQMSPLPYSIARFLRFASDREKSIVLLSLRSLLFIANRSLFFITHYWFMLWRRGIGGRMSASFFVFLAHLSRRLTRWAFIVYQWSVVRCRRPHFQTWISLKPVGQSWSNFMCSITGVGERLHKVLGQIELKLWFPWQQKAPIDL